MKNFSININKILASTTLVLAHCFKTDIDFSENMIKIKKKKEKKLALEQRWQFQRDILCAC